MSKPKIVVYEETSEADGFLFSEVSKTISPKRDWLIRENFGGDFKSSMGGGSTGVGRIARALEERKLRAIMSGGEFAKECLGDFTLEKPKVVFTSTPSHKATSFQLADDREEAMTLVSSTSKELFDALTDTLVVEPEIWNPKILRWGEGEGQPADKLGDVMAAIEDTLSRCIKESLDPPGIESMFVLDKTIKMSTMTQVGWRKTTVERESALILDGIRLSANKKSFNLNFSVTSPFGGVIKAEAKLIDAERDIPGLNDFLKDELGIVNNLSLFIRDAIIEDAKAKQTDVSKKVFIEKETEKPKAINPLFASW